eukprot:snap_masked-scaffold_22-processed-gene-4.31-mRNA-1 protein AED:1.00 eAED:1.00 QI:0/0/0/0/1/1/3/0/71
MQKIKNFIENLVENEMVATENEIFLYLSTVANDSFKWFKRILYFKHNGKYCRAILLVFPLFLFSHKCKFND